MWDSTSETEHVEDLTKACVLFEFATDFELLETILRNSEGGFLFEDLPSNDLQLLRSTLVFSSDSDKAHQTLFSAVGRH